MTSRMTFPILRRRCSLDDALKQAYDQRADLKAADAQVRAAERTLAAARAERLPALSVNGDVGEIGTTPRRRAPLTRLPPR